MYWYDPHSGHCVETPNGDVFKFELCNTATNPHKLYPGDKPSWRSEQVKRLIQSDASDNPIYIL